jgi:tRNA1Val (adenine37-N6)-methyltransferase
MRTPEKNRPDDETLDTFYRGKIRVLQKKKGYRFSVDAPLLADFVRTGAGDEILELGTGCGVISLLLSLKPFGRITALEIQPGLADLARRNVALNGLEERITVIEEDWRTFRPGRKYDVIFSNPPYIRGGTGFPSQTAEKNVARHEVHGRIADVMETAADLLAPDGRACFVFPEKRRQDFLDAAAGRGFGLRRFRAVHPRHGEPSNLFLAEIGLSHGAETGEILPPLVLFGAEGRYTDEAEEIFSGPGAS